MGIWILNGTVVNADNEMSQKHLYIDDGVIVSMIDAELDSNGTGLETIGHEVIDAQGCLVSAGFIDMHVHLREPGFEHKETIATGIQSAVRGGFTTIACMPNTRPVMDNVETIQYVLNKAHADDTIQVLPYGCITKNQLGRELTDFAALRKAGAIGFTDDGVGVQNAQMMKDAMASAAALNMPIIAHCEDNTLGVGAPVNEGSFASIHGLKGIPNESEAIHVGRDILLAEATGVHYHICHVSTEQSIRLIRLGKQVGVKVTAEVCPHHLLLSEEDIPGLDANWKMNPPLRSRQDVQACRQALEDGTIDIIVTDHAPHTAEEKAKGMELAPFGIIGFETAFPLLYTKFVVTGIWKLAFLIDRMTRKPAEVFNLPGGILKVGAPANITLVDLERERTVDPSQFATKGRNTPFIGWKLKGWPILTIASGKVVWDARA